MRMRSRKHGKSSRIRGRLSYSNIVASLALFIALGGISYAAVTLPTNSVGTKQLKKNAVVSSKVKNGSLLGADFKAGQLPSGAQGPAGPAGAAGATGDTGLAGPTGNTGPAGPSNQFHAVIDGATGTVAASQSSDGTTAVRVGAGTYRVLFTQNIRNCAYLGTLGEPGFTVLPSAGEIGTVGFFNNVNGVAVQTYNSAGASADRSFSLTVEC